MQARFQTIRLGGGWGLLLILVALLFLPFALLLGLLFLAVGILGSLVSLLLGRKPTPAPKAESRPPGEAPSLSGKILDAEYEVKDEP